ncbi:MAG: hypothetical protein EOQ62_23655 [Mesorhizobium sp.]|nr:MAG: hypothetical protein EOQ62_23655 [Mesorhizobium sp.]RWK99959.1 MAG: hypothetical protein EOR55_30785 [Mesorhizobium sp.]TIN10195.1 MAG: hypothetical protein E5Y14_11635 [Mesorhizobium sp.]TIQ61810.1 MAG: hypothetical protein E5X41_31590 [Mesorhizobium sp.]
MADQVLIVDDDRRLSALLKIKQSAKEINMSRFTALAMAAIIASSLPSFALSDEYNRSLNVKNDSDVAVVELYIIPIRPEGGGSGSDLIGPSYLNPGFKKSVKVPGGFCRFRVRIVYEDGYVFDKDANLCKADSLRLGGKLHHITVDASTVDQNTFAGGLWLTVRPLPAGRRSTSPT